MINGRRLRIASVGVAHTAAVQMRSRCLAVLGHDVRILSPEPADLPDLPVLAPGDGRASGARAKLRTYYRMAQALRRMEPDVVMVHFAASPFHWLVPLVTSAPVVVSVMGGDVLFDERPDMNWSPRRRRATLGLLELADLVIQMSAYMLRGLPEIEAKALVSAWGIDLGRYGTRDPATGDSWSRARLGIPADAPVVFSPRRVVPICNTRALVEALAQLSGRRPDVHLLVSGDHPDPAYQASVRELARARAVEDRVLWLPRVSDDAMPSLYRLSDVTASVALSDGVSLSVLDSMAAGTPVVLGDLPNYRDVFRHETDCLKVDPRSPEAIASSLGRILEDAELRTRIRDQGLATVRRIGDLDHESRRISSALEALADERPRRRLGPSARHALNLFAIQIGLD